MKILLSTLIIVFTLSCIKQPCENVEKDTFKRLEMQATQEQRKDLEKRLGWHKESLSEANACMSHYIKGEK